MWKVTYVQLALLIINDIIVNSGHKELSRLGGYIVPGLTNPLHLMCISRNLYPGRLGQDVWNTISNFEYHL